MIIFFIYKTIKIQRLIYENIFCIKSIFNLFTILKIINKQQPFRSKFTKKPKNYKYIINTLILLLY